MGVSHLLELDGPSCVALGEVSSIDMLPHSSGKRMLPFWPWEPFGHWLGRGSHGWLFSCWGALVVGGDGGDCPSKMW